VSVVIVKEICRNLETLETNTEEKKDENQNQKQTQLARMFVGEEDTIAPGSAGRARSEQQQQQYLSTLFLVDGVPKFIRTGVVPPGSRVYRQVFETWTSQDAPDLILRLVRVFYTDQARRELAKTNLHCFELLENSDKIIASIVLAEHYLVQMKWRVSPQNTMTMAASDDIIQRLFDSWTKRHPAKGWERHVHGGAAEWRIAAWSGVK
jgi:hypothetical protein